MADTEIRAQAGSALSGEAGSPLVEDLAINCHRPSTGASLGARSDAHVSTLLLRLIHSVLLRSLSCIPLLVSPSPPLLSLSPHPPACSTPLRAHQGIYNDPSCFNEENFILDHTVLVVGYHYEGLGSCNSNYFVLRNSWGTEWGENGYMRMAMEFNPYGVCGITSQLGLYPVIQGEQASWQIREEKAAPQVQRGCSIICGIASQLGLYPVTKDE